MGTGCIEIKRSLTSKKKKVKTQPESKKCNGKRSINTRKKRCIDEVEEDGVDDEEEEVNNAAEECETTSGRLTFGTIVEETANESYSRRSTERGERERERERERLGNECEGKVLPQFLRRQKGQKEGRNEEAKKDERLPQDSGGQTDRVTDKTDRQGENKRGRHTYKRTNVCVKTD